MILKDTRHLRDRADEVRLVAHEMQSPEATRALIMVAHGYDRLADHAENRCDEKYPQAPQENQST